MPGAPVVKSGLDPAIRYHAEIVQNTPSPQPFPRELASASLRETDRVEGTPSASSKAGMERSYKHNLNLSLIVYTLR